MIKYYQIKSIQLERAPGEKPGWSNFKIIPVAQALKYLVEVGQHFDEELPNKWYGKKHLAVKVVGVYDEEKAYISIKGTRKDIDTFLQKACMKEDFNTYWSWGETDKWHVDLNLKYLA